MLFRSNSLSGATLLEKELEIKRMREMIAQKEQLRLRKLVGVPTWCTLRNTHGAVIDYCPKCARTESDTERPEHCYP